MTGFDAMPCFLAVSPFRSQHTATYKFIVVDSNISSSIDMKDIDQLALDTLKPTWALNHPIEKPGMQGSEIANVILFLASDQARMINGVALPVDNAWSVI
jgi:NAD(P)-dependent dehydrogenase (short-subunit alcohol dehydrogenase family)